MGEKRQPVVFVGHGSPLNAIADNDIRRGWQEMGKRLGMALAHIEKLRVWRDRKGALCQPEKRFIHVWLSRQREQHPALDLMLVK